MLKVSFISKDEPVKEVQTYQDGKLTIVTLRGFVDCPEIVNALPTSILKWISINRHVKFNLTDGYIKTVGKAVRAVDDSDDPVFAVRLAEARAKYYLYKFMLNLTTRLIQYYGTILGTSTKIEEEKYSDNAFFSNTLIGVSVKYWSFVQDEVNHIKDLIKNKYGKDVTHGTDTESN